MNLRKFKRDPADLLRQGEEIAAARNIDPLGCNVWDGVTLSAYIKERFGSCAPADVS